MFRQGAERHSRPINLVIPLRSWKESQPLIIFVLSSAGQFFLRKNSWKKRICWRKSWNQSIETRIYNRITKSMDKASWQGWRRLQLNLIVDEIWTEYSWKFRLKIFMKQVFWVDPGFWKSKESKKISKMLFFYLAAKCPNYKAFLFQVLKGNFWSAQWHWISGPKTNFVKFRMNIAIAICTPPPQSHESLK